MKRCILMLAGVLLATYGCASTSKQCVDGVCKITENGKVRYEGDPEKVAALKAKDEAKANRANEIQQAYVNAPKRNGETAIRVALVPPTTGSKELKGFTKGFHKMLNEEFGNEDEFELVPYKAIKKYMAMASQLPEDEFSKSGSSGWSSSRGRKQNDAPPLKDIVTRMRDYGAEVDVLIFTQLNPKTETGMIRGSKGAGLAQVERVELSGRISSLYLFEAHTLKEVGKSTSSLAVAGMGKKKGKKGKKFQKGQMKMKRNIEHDRDAVKAYVARIKSLIKDTISPQLPSIAAVQEIREKYATSKKPEEQKDLGSAIRNLFGK